MSILAALKEGITLATRHWRALLVVYLCNLALAGSVAIPVYKTLDANLSNSESAEKMAEGFDWLWYQEFISSRDQADDVAASVRPWQQGVTTLLVNFERYVRGDLRSSLPAQLFWIGIIYLLVTTFLTGGILGLFAEEEARFTFRFFFDRAGRYFMILAAIIVVANIAYWLLWEVAGINWQRFVSYIRSEATTEWTPVLLDWLGAVLLLVIAFFIRMVMDYSRIAAVAWHKMGLLPALLGAIVFSLNNLKKTVGLFYLTTALAILLAAAYGLLITTGSGATTSGLIAMLLVQQGFIIATIWIRMVYLGGQLSFYRYAMDVPGWAGPTSPSADGDEEGVVIDGAVVLEADLPERGSEPEEDTDLHSHP